MTLPNAEVTPSKAAMVIQSLKANPIGKRIVVSHLWKVLMR
jgi:hypothetical protein